ncbi:DUF6243 family protein [Streptomyces sp. TRM76323]|uniref:DUF6243 family protein n=1 Tax=Streptomyces tamarix TaxID=3078565 RepID=A0ABU3QJU3_9ACTN|nr:DUF6243 family protein [Streptomyces tamarix]MDT9683037.1 DUF6243 family protein [Streptomyces tamarix]
MAKSRNNLLGVGGQRKKLSRLERQGSAPHGAGRAADAADAKQELLRRMRERTRPQQQEQETPETQERDRQS